jgi:hypothetical protein
VVSQHLGAHELEQIEMSLRVLGDESYEDRPHGGVLTRSKSGDQLRQTVMFLPFPINEVLEDPEGPLSDDGIDDASTCRVWAFHWP